MSRSHRSRQSDTPLEQVVVEGFLRAIWSGLTFLFRRGGGRGGGKRPLSVSEATRRQLQAHWEEVEWYVEREEYAGQAVLEADKTLDAVLRELHLPGASMGERLKHAAPLLPADLYQQVWQYHKIRNQLAHEAGFVVRKGEAEVAVAVFRRALQVLGILEQ
jgi:hypothetical protein